MKALRIIAAIASSLIALSSAQQISPAAQDRTDFKGLFQNFNEIKPELDLSKMTFLEQASHFGYPVVKSHVVTDDGYILELHRIPGAQNETLEHALEVVRSGKRQPALFVHGLLGSSQQWIANGPGKAWGFAAVDSGLCDAWFINLRGSRYSREHKRFDANSDAEFWAFSFEEFGAFDLPAAVRAILADPDQPLNKVALIAYSEGTTAAFYGLSQTEKKEEQLLSEHVSILIALGPMTQLTNVEEPVLKLLGWQSWIAQTLADSGYLEMFGQMTEDGASKVKSTSDIAFICIYFPEICKGDISALTDPVDLQRINAQYFEAYQARAGREGTSLRNLHHLGQLTMANAFSRFDYEDPELNFSHYATRQAPVIDLASIKTPVAVFVGVDDPLATLADSMEMRKKLDPSSLLFFKSYEADHISLIMGKDTETLNKDMLDLLKFSFSKLDPVTSNNKSTATVPEEQIQTAR